MAGNSIQIKICGIRTPAAADAVADARADALGLVFVERSPRHVTLEEAAGVVAALPASVEPVGLFVDPDDQPGAVDAAVERLGLKTLQLHGRADQTTDRLADRKIVRVVAFDPAEPRAVLRRADRWAAAHDNVVGVIVDTPDPSGIGGGTGEVFDWSRLGGALAEVAPVVPIILAGGLTPENVAEAVRVIRPSGVDVSSGVELSRGVKDPGKIAAFCRAVRSVR